MAYFIVLQRVNLWRIPYICTNLFMQKLLLIFLLIPLYARPDAGFNIGRPKAPCHAVFTGINDQPAFEFYLTGASGYRGRNEMDSSGRIHENDTVRMYYEDERRYRDGYKVVVYDRNGRQVDSLLLRAEGYDLAVHFKVDKGKLVHSLDRTKAAYPYNLYEGENVDRAAAVRNKYILIAMSVTGFLLLFFMLFKRRIREEKTA